MGPLGAPVSAHPFSVPSLGARSAEPTLTDAASLGQTKTERDLSPDLGGVTGRLKVLVPGPLLPPLSWGGQGLWLVYFINEKAKAKRGQEHGTEQRDSDRVWPEP